METDLRKELEARVQRYREKFGEQNVLREFEDSYVIKTDTAIGNSYVWLQLFIEDDKIIVERDLKEQLAVYAETYKKMFGEQNVIKRNDEFYILNTGAIVGNTHVSLKLIIRNGKVVMTDLGGYEQELHFSNSRHMTPEKHALFAKMMKALYVDFDGFEISTEMWYGQERKTYSVVLSAILFMGAFLDLELD